MTGWSEAIGLKASERVGQTGRARIADVSAVDPINHAIKVVIQPDGVETGWIPDPGLAVGSLSIACPSQIGSQVLVESVEGDPEHPVVLARIFDVKSLPPVSPITGKQAQPGELLAMAGQGAGPTQDGGSVAAATPNAAWFHLTPGAFYAGAGNAVLTIENGTIVATVAGCTMTLSASGLAVTGGTITSDTDVLADGISGKGHHHGGVQTGNDVTGVPQ